MSVLSTLQSLISDRLTAQTFFSASPEIPVVTEVKGDLANRIATHVKQTGLAVLVTTPTTDIDSANDPEPRYNKITVQVSIFEHPAVNRTGQPASLVAEAVAWWLHAFTPTGFNGPINLKGIDLGDDPQLVRYDVTGELVGCIATEPSRV